MLKWLSFWRWIVAALIVVGTITFVAHKQHSAAEKYTRHHQEYCSALTASAEEKKACIEEGTKATDYLPWGYILVAWPEGITTWAIILTGIVIAWQAWETRKAAEATRESVPYQEAAASAANTNALALINSERAWVMAELKCAPGTLVAHFDGAEGPATTVMEVELHCINNGSSPAWITEKSARLVIVSKGEQLPAIPQLAKEDILDMGMDPVGPRKEDNFFKWDATGNGRHSFQTQTIIYGVVKYRDIFGESRETWFCYQLRGDAAHRKLYRVFCGPEYSKHT